MQTPTDLTRAASVHWDGDVSRGKGTIAVESGKVTADYSFGTRFSGDPGTNPEELLAAAHASCFTMALSLALTRDGHPPTAIDTKASVHLHRDNQGVTIPKIELSATVTAPGADAEEFQRLAKGAKENCPVSRALNGVEIELDARLNP